MAAKERLYLCNILSPVRVLLILFDSLVHSKYQNIVSLFLDFLVYFRYQNIVSLFFCIFTLENPKCANGTPNVLTVSWWSSGYDTCLESNTLGFDINNLLTVTMCIL